MASEAIAGESMTRQIDLFGADEALCAASVAPARGDEGQAAIARRLPPGLRLGTSSWSFPGWHGLVYGGRYPEAVLSRYGLAAYAQHPLLNAVGVDRTFYAPMEVSEYRAYASQVPTDFRFIVKAPAVATTPPERLRDRPAAGRFLDASYLADALLEPAREGLGQRLGAVLLQFPPLGLRWVGQPQRFAEHLVRCLDALSTTVPIAVELRDAALLTSEYTAALNAVGAVHCFNLHPRMPAVARQLELLDAIPDPCIVRWMLHPSQTYEAARERYRPFGRLVDADLQGRAAVAGLCAAALARDTAVCVIANNKAEGSAPLTLLELAKSLAGRTGSMDDS